MSHVNVFALILLRYILTLTHLCSINQKLNIGYNTTVII
jgi:hypothetical protein